MNPIDFFKHLRENKERMENEEKIIRKELVEFYQLNVLGCFEKGSFFDEKDFVNDFTNFMKENYPDIEGNYCIKSYADNFLKEVEENKRDD